MSIARTSLVLSLFFWSVAHSAAGIQLDYWHCYTNKIDGQVHYSFHVSKSKHGLFMGPCGFSTKQIQWQYNFDLAGIGPTYRGAEISMSDFDGKQVSISSGSILIETNLTKATINLSIAENSQTNQFAGNGKLEIGKLK